MFPFYLFMIHLNIHTKFATMNSKYKFDYGPDKYSTYSHLETSTTKLLLNSLLHLY